MASKGGRIGIVLIRIVLSGILLVSLFSACGKKNIEPEVVDNPEEAVWKLNKNVEGLKNLAAGCAAADSIAIFSIQYNDDGSVLYRVNMKEGGDVNLYSEVVTLKIKVPELSMNQVGNDFFWTINGSFLTDLNGERIAVADDSEPISFHLLDESIVCKVRESVVGEYPTTKADYLARDVALDYDVDKSVFKLRLSSGFSTMLPTVEGFRLLKENVPNQSYYKDIFLDAGIGLTSRKSLAAASYLGLSLEGVSFSRSTNEATSEEYDLQNAILGGDADDLNGRLLFPDGQPRFKLLFVNGGNALQHGQSLTEESRNNMSTFFENGGSYVGTCAGAFFASKGSGGNPNNPYYISIWPGVMNQTGLKDTYTGIIIEEKSPLLSYDGLGGTHYVDSVRHNGGGFPRDLPDGTEVLARYDYEKKSAVHHQPAIWAYKRSAVSGRMVNTGSHPEEVWSGERRELTAAMVRYALDGRGSVSIKGYLENGVERLMEKGTNDHDPGFSRIGDLQTHHFATYIPSDAINIRVELHSSSAFDLVLLMNQDTYAFPELAEYKSVSRGANQHLDFSSLREGLWYISVKCMTTVKVEDAEYGKTYVGNTEVLNGVPYSIKITWDKVR